jgi:tRNA pseudouridine65 synthase
VDILFRDEHLVVVNKPSGLLTHRGWGDDGVVAMTLARDAVGTHVYPVHRLDRGASGVLVFALDRAAARGLHEAFEAGIVRKRYLALVRGIPPEEGTVDHPIPRREGGPRVPAVTRFRRLGTFERYGLVEALPESGRLHQVRRHLKHVGHPIIGDVNYGRGELNRLFRERFGLRRLALHAREIACRHPLTGAPLSLLAPVPPDLAGPLSDMGLAVAAL